MTKIVHKAPTEEVQKADREAEAAVREEKANFARAVHALMRSRRDQHAWQSAPDSVRRVAGGFVCLLELLSLQDGPKPAEEAAAIGQAYGLLDALLTGQSHPVWDFIEGLNAAGYRSANRAPPALDSKFRRAVVLALVKELATDRRNAIVSAVQLLKESGIEVSANQIKGWRARADRETDAMIEQCRKQIARRSKEHGISRPREAVEWAKLLWTAPSARPKLESTGS